MNMYEICPYERFNKMAAVLPNNNEILEFADHSGWARLYFKYLFDNATFLPGTRSVAHEPVVGLPGIQKHLWNKKNVLDVTVFFVIIMGNIQIRT